MVRELKIIFGGDAVAGHLGVARQILVLLVKLLGVAAGAIVDAVATATAGTPRIALRPLAATTATAAALTIVDQRMSSTSPKNLSVPAPSSSFSNSVGCAAWGSRASRAGSRHLPARPGHNRVLSVGMGGPFRTAVRR